MSTLAQELNRRDYHVTVFCAEKSDSTDDYRMVRDEVEGVAVFRVVNNFKHIRSFEQTFVDPEVEKLFLELVDDLSPDLIHYNHLISLSARLPQLASDLGIPGVITLHDFWFLCQRINLLDWTKSRCPGPTQGGDCYTCVTRGTWWQQLRTWVIDGMRALVPYGIRTQIREWLSTGDSFLPDLHATPEVLDRRYHLFRESALSSKRLITPSLFMKTMFARNGYPKNAIEVVPLGLENTESSPSERVPADDLTFGFVGSLVPLKGVDALIQAFKKVKGEQARLWLYGRDDVVPRYGRRLRKLARGESRLSFMGPFSPDEKDAVYDEIDVLVVPSLAHESFSLVTREALQRGKPVIASALGALPEIVLDGVNGFLVEPGDVEDLRKTMQKLVADPSILTSLRVPGPVEILSVSEHVDLIEEIYQEACAR